MTILMYLLSILLLIMGIFSTLIAKSSIHEIYAAVNFLISATLFAGACITRAANGIQDNQERIIALLAVKPSAPAEPDPTEEHPTEKAES